MIDEATIEQAWLADPWRTTSRGMRRFFVALPAVLGVFFWAFVPLELLGAALSDDGDRRELLGYAALNFGLGLAAVTAAVVLERHFAPEHRAEDELRRTGLRVTGRLLKVRPVPAAGKIPTHRFYLFGAEAPGGPVFARLTARWGIPVGCPVTIAYDPARPGDGVVVEPAAELRRRAG